MDKSMELLFSKIDEKLNQQTKILTAAVTKNVMEAIDERFKAITEENTKLKTKISSLEQKLNTIELEKRKYNLVFFGIEESGKGEAEMVDYIKDIIIETGTYIESHEIKNIYRIGKKNNKSRPVVVTIASIWKKHIILKNKTHLPPGIYVKEDFTREVLEQRKQLQPQLMREREKGNIAFLKYDKLIVKKPTEKTRDKRKREETGSPNSHNTSTQKKINSKEMTNTVFPKSSAKEIIKPNIFNYVERGRTASLSEISKN
ncbi:unnamed protein product [Colias eurytheme]|nr:unnamed protein product [Colias eurytheme]CAG4981035.1 unnamed protein product [Colias eurytheme]